MLNVCLFHEQILDHLSLIEDKTESELEAHLKRVVKSPKTDTETAHMVHSYTSSLFTGSFPHDRWFYISIKDTLNAAFP